MQNLLQVRSLGNQPYETVWAEMKQFTDQRDDTTLDEIWLVEHPPVFTLGQAGKREHILTETSIPIVESDRGGQVTYHGPGQLVAYLMIDLKRKKLGVRDLVTGIESSIIAFLAEFDVVAAAQKQAPGVYVNGDKIAALGLRVRRGCSYHGLSLNIDVDMSAFTVINPCGYEGLGITQLKDLGIMLTMDEVAGKLVNHIQTTFRYDALQWNDN